MPASVIALNRENNGICAEACTHLDCLAARAIAAERCRICKEYIGFELPFYAEVDAKVHRRCVEVEIAKKLQTDVELCFLTVEETASLLRVEVGTIRNWVSQNKIPFRKAGGNILFLLEEILSWTLPPARQKAAGLKAVE
jgi:excisionase family DNA binding protein